MSTACTADRPKADRDYPAVLSLLARAAVTAQPDRDGPAHLGLGRRARSLSELAAEYYAQRLKRYLESSLYAAGPGAEEQPGPAPAAVRTHLRSPIFI